MTTTNPDPARPIPVARARLTTVLVLGGASLAPAAVWLIARLTGAEMLVALGDGTPMVIDLPAVLIAALVAAVAGWATLAVLRRLTRRARGVWTILAVVSLAASLAPAATATAEPATRAYLIVMHLCVAAVLIPGLRLTGVRSRRRS